jgi:hypothetical protein
VVIATTAACGNMGAFSQGIWRAPKRIYRGGGTASWRRLCGVDRDSAPGGAGDVFYTAPKDSSKRLRAAAALYGNESATPKGMFLPSNAMGLLL